MGRTEDYYALMAYFNSLCHLRPDDRVYEVKYTNELTIDARFKEKVRGKTGFDCWSWVAGRWNWNSSFFCRAWSQSNDHR
ncbi:hypothetical protein CANDROIZ_170018 [Candidatus Roizmanbacteria bacterium]|nr:hypothetical protein CANDROIZ_170018 [Candidatus Roizmanbacteria bacterium]